MTWFRIPKELAGAVAPRPYGQFKPRLATEGRFQCVYCTIREPSWGGYRNFAVEHLRPKKRFAELINNYGNLFYCCSACNSFKGEDWPNEPTPQLDCASYPDPSQVDYSRLFSIGQDAKVTGINRSGKYIVARLHLNRPQLIMEREEVRVRARLATSLRSLRSARIALRNRQDAKAVELLGRLLDLTLDLHDAEQSLRQARPYAPDEMRVDRE